MAAVNQPALSLRGVYKKFARGERHDSLRDLIPALAKRMLTSMVGPPQLKEQEFWALQDVSFEIGRGETVGIVGHNGAGKSTLLKHLSGLIRPTSGTVEVRGRLSALIEVGAGFHHDLTGRENIFLNGVILGMSRAEVRRKFDEIVAFSGLAEFIDTPVKRYSSGMYARLGFSVAAHMEPDILVIDEVLSVGDMVFQAKGVEKMRQVARSGATVIFVSHNLRAVADLCPRSLLFHRGRLVQDDTTSAVIRSYMEQVKLSRSHATDAEVVIESVTVRGADKARFDFTAGEKAWVDIRIKALRDVKRVACVLYLRDDQQYEMFHTSTERLGHAPLDLREGETRTVTYELDLHLAAGSFHINSALHRYDINHKYDVMEPAATIFVRTPIDVRGAANLYPTVTISAS